MKSLFFVRVSPSLHQMGIASLNKNGIAINFQLTCNSTIFSERVLFLVSELLLSRIIFCLACSSCSSCVSKSLSASIVFLFSFCSTSRVCSCSVSLSLHSLLSSSSSSALIIISHIEEFANCLTDPLLQSPSEFLQLGHIPHFHIQLILQRVALRF